MFAGVARPWREIEVLGPAEGRGMMKVRFVLSDEESELTVGAIYDPKKTTDGYPARLLPVVVEKPEKRSRKRRR